MRRVTSCGRRRASNVMEVAPTGVSARLMDRSGRLPSVTAISTRADPAVRWMENDPHPRPVEKNDAKPDTRFFGINPMAFSPAWYSKPLKATTVDHADMARA